MKSKIRVTKIFRFEMAHALWNYNGLCKNLHGHSYLLEVTVSGNPKQETDNYDNGMVIDFGLLKSIVNENIVDKYDHALVLNKDGVYPFNELNSGLFDRIIYAPYQPTCENMLIDFAEVLKSALPNHVTLEHLKLHETSNSFAEWLSTDN